MGQAKQKLSVTKRFIRQYPHCCFCAGERSSATREHMPPKSVFNSSHKPDKLIMPACDECNRGTSTADLITAVVSRWGYLNTEQENVDHRRLVNQVRRQAPNLIEEWTKPIDRIGARGHLEKHGVFVPTDAGMVSIGPLTIQQLNQFASKFVLALYFEHFREPLPVDGRLAAFWRSKEDFGQQGIPPVLLELMQRYGTLEQGKWNVREVFEYRYELNEADGLFACLGRFRGNLFVTGFAARDGAVLPADEADWIRPLDLLTIPTDDHFKKRN